MEIAPLVAHDRQVVQAYGQGGFRVSDRDWPGAIIVFPTRTVVWTPGSFADLTLSAFEPVRDASDPPIELLLIGCGARMALIKSQLRAELRAWGLAIEPMDTGAACRTYNLLVAEERRVAAALLPLD